MIIMIMMILKGGCMEGTDDLQDTVEGGEEEGDYEDEEEYEDDQQDATQVNKP